MTQCPNNREIAEQLKRGLIVETVCLTESHSSSTVFAENCGQTVATRLWDLFFNLLIKIKDINTSIKESNQQIASEAVIVQPVRERVVFL